eukprot:1244705-Amphidinium_carterae.1
MCIRDSSFASFSGYGQVNESTPNLPWLIVPDAAPVHVAVDFRKRLYTDLPWVKWCFVNAGTTAHTAKWWRVEA